MTGSWLTAQQQAESRGPAWRPRQPCASPLLPRASQIAPEAWAWRGTLSGGTACREARPGLGARRAALSLACGAAAAGGPQLAGAPAAGRLRRDAGRACGGPDCGPGWAAGAARGGGERRTEAAGTAPRSARSAEERGRGTRARGRPVLPPATLACWAGATSPSRHWGRYELPEGRWHCAGRC